MTTLPEMPERGRPWAIAALVCGVLAVPGVFLPPAGTYLGVSAIVAWIIARRRGTGGWVGIAGAITGFVGMLVGTFLAVGLCGPSVLVFVCEA